MLIYQRITIPIDSLKTTAVCYRKVQWAVIVKTDVHLFAILKTKIMNVIVCGFRRTAHLLQTHIFSMKRLS